MISVRREVRPGEQREKKTTIMNYLIKKIEEGIKRRRRKMKEIIKKDIQRKELKKGKKKK